MLTAPRPHRIGSDLRTGHEDSPTLELQQPSQLTVHELWIRALEDYRKTVGVDLFNSDTPSALELAICETSDAIVDVIDGAARRLWKKREGSKTSQRLRRVLQPLVHGLSVILEASAETSAALGIPGGKGIFAAVTVLIKAAEDVSATFNDLEKLLKRFTVYVERLQVRVRAPLGREARIIAVKALVEMLKAFALATKMLRMNRFGLFVNALLAKGGEVRDANSALQELMSDEERMAVTELLVNMEELSVQVNHVEVSVAHLSEMALEKTSVILTELRESKIQRRLDVDDMRTMLQDLLAAQRVVCTSSASNSARHGGSKRDHYGVGRQVCRVVHRLSSADQDIVWRALATLFSIAMDHTAPPNCNLAAPLSSTSTRLTQVVETALPMASTFLLIFMIWKLYTISRPLGPSGGSIILIDVLGEVHELHQDTFASWETTHAFLIQAFRGRPGASYVAGHNYALGNSEYPLISPENWSHAVRTGTKLNMSVTIETLGALCPYCQTANTGSEASLGDGRTICSGSYCGRPYSCYRDLNSISFEPCELMSESRPFHRRISDRSKSASMGLFQRVVVEYWSQAEGEGIGHDAMQLKRIPKVHQDGRYSDKVDYMLRLHNWLGRIQQTSNLQWQCASDGPQDFPAHHVVAILNGVAIGQGRAPSKSEAKQYAAFKALECLGQE